MKNLLFTIALAMTFSNLIAQDDKIMFVSKADGSVFNTIWSMDSNGNNKIALFNDQFHRTGLAVSESSQKIAFVKYGPDGIGTEEYSINQANIDGSEEEVIWMVENWNERGVGGLDFSPTGDRLIFKYYELSTDRNSDIYEINIATQEYVNLTNDWDYEEWRPKYSPDGTEIIYQYCPTGWYHWPINLHKMDADGNNKTELANDDGFTDGNTSNWSCDCRIDFSNYSSDGETIVYSRGNFSGLWTMGTNGENEINIPYQDGVNWLLRFPLFGPEENSDEIYFVRDSTLVLIDLNGNLLQEIPDTGHSSYAFTTFLKGESVAIETINKNAGINVFPNPIRPGELLTIQTSLTYFRFELINVLGQKVDAQVNTNSYTLPKVKSGIYFIHFFDNKNNLLQSLKIDIN